MREIGLTDVRSKIFLWAHHELDSKRASLVRNGFSPVAVFDREYDELGIVPHRDGKLPVLHAGALVNRTLCLFNDEFSDEKVDVEIELKAVGKTVASGKMELRVPLGGKRSIECVFEVPHHATFDLVRIASKNGREVFRESFTYEADKIIDGQSTTSEIHLQDASPEALR